MRNPARRPRAEIILINKKSVGTITINGTPHTYNPHLIYQDTDVPLEQVVEDSQPRPVRRVIVIRRRR